MPTHLALLRGVNVTGHNILKMDALKKSLTRAGYGNVKTYIQSGNVFVDTPNEDAESVGKELKQLILGSFGLNVCVIVINKSHLETCLENNPFLKEPNADLKKLYVVFSLQTLSADTIEQFKTIPTEPEKLAFEDNRIYIKYAESAGKTKLNLKSIEKKLNLTLTARNWNTILKLLSMYST